MASQSNRPLYVPPAKRRQALASSEDGSKSVRKRPQRFHGAFTGGFSAGYYNTVGSKEGWKPSEESRREQKLEDFMDEEDHEDWGGPTNVRENYNAAAATPSVDGLATMSSSHTSQATALVPKISDKSETSEEVFSFGRLFQVSHQTVGPRLLRLLGWREERETGESAAYVSQDNVVGVADVEAVENPAHQQTLGKGDGSELSNVLSAKRLRKVRLQQTRTKLPIPKLDQCGLGFEPYADAPEFRQFKERRGQLARERARGGNSRDVYRASHIFGKPTNKNMAEGAEGILTHYDDAYVSHETAEDFIGKKSSAGFAMRDDEDDAYDDDDAGINRSILTLTSKQRGQPVNAIQVSRGEYNTEVYEHASSDESDDYAPAKERNNGPDSRRNNDFGGVLAAFANTSTGLGQKKQEGTMPHGVLMSDGRPPLEGFVLGGSFQTHVQRYPGPDIPVHEELQRHVFGANEHPLVFQTLSRAEQLVLREERDKYHVQQDAMNVERKTEQAVDKLNPRTANHEEKPILTAMAGDRFSGLALAMKTRFTKGENKVSSTSGATSQDSPMDSRESLPPIGLSIPRPTISSRNASANPTMAIPTVATEIKVKRTIQSFVPDPLVCKRLHVPPPRHLDATTERRTSSLALNPSNNRTTESEYFEKEILTVATNYPNNGGALLHGNTAQNDSLKKRKSESGSSDDTNAINDILLKDESSVKGEMRVPLATLKSIFEPGSSSTDLSEDDSSIEGGVHHNPVAALGGQAQQNPHLSTSSKGDDDQQASTQQLDLDQNVVDNDKHQFSRKAQHGKERRHRNRREKQSSGYSYESNSCSSRDDVSDSHDRKRRKKERRRERKRRKTEKKERKKSSSSKRKGH